MAEPNLHIDETFQRRQRRTDRAGWLLMALILLVALVGGLGAGFSGQASATSERGQVQVEYERIEHQQADGALTVTVGTATTEDLTVALTGDWVEFADLNGITPEPDQQLAMPDGIMMVFGVAAAGDLRISLAYRMQRVGPLAGQVSVGDQTVAFRQFVLP